MSQYPKTILSPEGSPCTVDCAADEATLRSLWGQDVPAHVESTAPSAEDLDAVTAEAEIAEETSAPAEEIPEKPAKPEKKKGAAKKGKK